MFSAEMRLIYQRFLVLGLLCGCLVFFSTWSVTETAFAARCIQECMSAQALCEDNCVDECSSTDELCTSCLLNCESQFNSCARSAMYCSNAPVENGRCEVGFGDHCEENDVNCVSPHSGYFQICDALGGQQCVACPTGETCPSAGGLPPCY